MSGASASGWSLVHVCVTCRRGEEGGEPGRVLFERAAALARAVPGIAVAPVRCLGACGRGCSAALNAVGKWSYVFGDLDPEAGAAADLLAGARLHLASADGLLPWSGRPPSLRKVVARLPAPDIVAAEPSPPAEGER